MQIGVEKQNLFFHIFVSFTRSPRLPPIIIMEKEHHCGDVVKPAVDARWDA